MRLTRLNKAIFEFWDTTLSTTAVPCSTDINAFTDLLRNFKLEKLGEKPLQ